MSKLPIVERLEEAERDLSWSGIERGCVDSSLSASLAHDAATTITELVSALEECQRALATMVEPNAIRTTTTINAYAMAHQAEARARTALSNVRGDTP